MQILIWVLEKFGIILELIQMNRKHESDIEKYLGGQTDLQKGEIHYTSSCQSLKGFTMIPLLDNKIMQDVCVS